MVDQPKLTRLLRLIDLLRPPGKTIGFIASFLECDERTAYRYLRNFEDEGFSKRKDKAKRFSISEPLGRGVKVALTEEEAYFMSLLIATAAPSHHLAPTLQAKLLFRSNIGKLTKHKFRRNVPNIVEQLLDAMKMNRQVTLNTYFSASLGMEQSRTIEPLEFTENYRYLLAYDATAGIVVNLRLDRIVAVQILEERCTKSPNMLLGVDVFDMAFNEERHPITLLLNPLAYRLLLEEYPATESHIAPSGNELFPFRFSAPVANLLTVGRFCLGLPGSIQPQGPDALLEYLKEKIKKFTW
ncbi:MAG: WYL domain-containing protein [Saprospiraceae bacterium]|nr:WYL domain-containing protein [Saprospiraceae bacterium]MCF8252460.1 WYL domain-containing protein [Saprospiraceae bacterium]MCF8282327.1 WYL domain-containing protein [Bacteroidales bacterium]MCF8314053.1 WYL domain-containing protein [Saprospiraceae bacterium]MCF8442791.1 WYL domain-containing protein [Saprospiraceae bacterium]